MAMRELQKMVRTPSSWWKHCVDVGSATGRTGAEVVRRWIFLGALSDGVKLPEDQTTVTASERKAKKREKLRAELEALG